MQQALISLDFGNSHPHAGFFKKEGNRWNLIEVAPLKLLDKKAANLDISPHNASLVLCEVRKYDKELFDLQSQGYLLTRVKDYWRGARFAGMPVHYAQTLGEDRLISAFWVYKNINKPSLIIDAGTYLTLDVVTTAGFIGGYIAPSYKKYLETFSEGENLKNIHLKESLNFNIPSTTEEAISASYQAFTSLAEKLIQEYRLESIIISGGDDSLWRAWSENQNLEVLHAPHLIHESLIYWMTTQVELL